MAEDRPHGSGVSVGTGVDVGVMVGVAVAVLVAGLVEDAVGVSILSGAVQPAKTDKSKSQEMSFIFE